MTFQQLYQIEKEANGGKRPIVWLQGVAVNAIVSTETAYQWGVGHRTPQKAAAKMVADFLGIPAEELFPNTKTARQ